MISKCFVWLLELRQDTLPSGHFNVYEITVWLRTQGELQMLQTYTAESNTSVHSGHSQTSGTPKAQERMSCVHHTRPKNYNVHRIGLSTVQ